MRAWAFWRSLLPRMWRHAVWDEARVARLVGAGADERLARQVAASEALHSGEIRVCVEASLPLGALWDGVSPRERALAVFGQLRVWDTEANNGVLIYVLVAEHAIEIVADRGLARRVPPATWSLLVEQLRKAFRAGAFEAGLTAAIEGVHAELLAHFPRLDGQSDTNELPDPVVWR